MKCRKGMILSSSTSSSEELDQECEAKCTVCAIIISQIDIENSKVYAHPILSTLLCEKCYSRIEGADLFDKSLCVWCGLKKEEFVKCIDCLKLFCKKCLKTNHSLSMFQYILKRKQWKCFICIPTPLNKHKKVCKGIMNTIKLNTNLSDEDSNIENKTQELISHINLEDSKEQILRISSEMQLLCTTLQERGNTFETTFLKQDHTKESIIQTYNFLLKLISTVSHNASVWNEQCSKEIAKLNDNLDGFSDDLSVKSLEKESNGEVIPTKRRKRTQLRLKARKLSDSEASEEESVALQNYVIKDKVGSNSGSQTSVVMEDIVNSETANIEKVAETTEKSKTLGNSQGETVEDNTQNDKIEMNGHYDKSKIKTAEVYDNLANSQSETIESNTQTADIEMGDNSDNSQSETVEDNTQIADTEISQNFDHSLRETDEDNTQIVDVLPSKNCDNSLSETVEDNTQIVDTEIRQNFDNSLRETVENNTQNTENEIKENCDKLQTKTTEISDAEVIKSHANSRSKTIESNTQTADTEMCVNHDNSQSEIVGDNTHRAADTEMSKVHNSQTETVEENSHQISVMEKSKTDMQATDIENHEKVDEVDVAAKATVSNSSEAEDLNKDLVDMKIENDTSGSDRASLFSQDTVDLNQEEVNGDTNSQSTIIYYSNSENGNVNKENDIGTEAAIDNLSENFNAYSKIEDIDQCLNIFSEDDSDSVDLDLSSVSSESDTEPLDDVDYHISNKLPELPQSSSSTDLTTKSETSETANNYSKQYNFKTCSVMLVDLQNEMKTFLNSLGYIILSQQEDKESKETDRLTKEEKKRKICSDKDSGSKRRKRSSQESDSISIPTSSSDSEDEYLSIENFDLTSSDTDIQWSDTGMMQDAAFVIDSDTDESELSDDDNKKSTTSKAKKTKNGSDDDNEEEKVTVKDENPSSSKRSAWRNDPALRAKLTDSESDSDASTSNDKRKKKRKNSKERSESPDVSIIESNKEDDVTTKQDKNVNASDSDSSIEFVKTYKQKKKRKSMVVSSDDSTDMDEFSLTPKGRKNIRAIASDDSLAVSTQRANAVEKTRKERIKKKQKTVFENYSQLSQSTDEMVLDVDEETNTPTISVNSTLVRNLKPHQRKGVQFMFDCCYESAKQIKSNSPGTGCILAHSMGLGKTLQVVTLIHTLFAHSFTNTKYVLVVCPLSIVLNWKNEFTKGLHNLKDNVNINIICISERGNNMQRRDEKIRSWKNKTGVLIMGYESYHVLTMPKNPDKHKQYRKLIKNMLVNPGPDLVVLDEGHLLKNGSALRTRALMEIKTQRRIILTGTPLQNNLKEYYYMINFVKPNLLGSYKEFTNRFANPINNGQYHDSTEGDIKQMKKRSHVLHSLLNESVFQRYEASELQTYLPKKYDYVLLIQLHPLQAELYTKYLERTSGEQNSIQRKIFLHFYNLQLITLHPYLLHLKEQCIKQKKEWSDSLPANANNETINVTNDWWHSICPADFKTNIDYGPKYKVMLSIIRESEAVGDKVIIFSNSLVDLDAIEAFLDQQSTETSRWKRNADYFRVDGSVAPEKRLEMCHKFNEVNNKQMRVFLVSHKVGDLGINLIGANRLILMTVSWNPACDSQSVFRLYRFGQTKRCYIYRLVCKGTMEEVIYGRQINKLCVSGRVIDKRQTERHFKSTELQQMFTLDYKVDLPKQLHLKTPSDDLLTTILHLHPEVCNYHEHQSLLENKPHEHLNNEEMNLAWEEFNKENDEKENREKEILRAKEIPPGQNLRPPNYLPDQVQNSTAYSSTVTTELRKELQNIVPPLPTSTPMFEEVYVMNTHGIPNQKSKNMWPANASQRGVNFQHRILNSPTTPNQVTEANQANPRQSNNNTTQGNQNQLFNANAGAINNRNPPPNLRSFINPANRSNTPNSASNARIQNQPFNSNAGAVRHRNPNQVVSAYQNNTAMQANNKNPNQVISSYQHNTVYQPNTNYLINPAIRGNNSNNALIQRNQNQPFNTNTVSASGRNPNQQVPPFPNKTMIKAKTDKNFFLNPARVNKRNLNFSTPRENSAQLQHLNSAPNPASIVRHLHNTNRTSNQSNVQQNLITNTDKDSDVVVIDDTPSIMQNQNPLLNLHLSHNSAITLSPLIKNTGQSKDNDAVIELD